MSSIINSTTTSPGGLISTGDSSNSLLIQTGDTTAITVNSSQVVSLTNPLPVASGGTGASSNAAAPFALKGANTDITALSGLSGGSASTPAVSPTGDSNTGIFFPAADTIAFTEGGAEAMRIDSSGNVGIGTSSPTARLTVVTGAAGNNEGEIRISENATYYASLRRVNATDEFRIGSYGSSQNITFYTVSSEQARITSAGLMQFNSGYGSVATAYGCRAWVNFNGTGTVAIRASGNVSSITDNGTGDYTINYTNAMPDANYATQITGRTDNDTSIRVIGYMANANSSLATAVRIQFHNLGAYYDTQTANVAIFR